MQIAKNKTATTIAIFLILAITATLVALPIANAHYPAWTVPTWAYIYAAPNPIGVNQQAMLMFWINTVPPTSAGAFGDRWTFYVDVTRPDGSNETLGPIKSDPIGSGYTTYTPTQVGIYTLVLRFPGQVITGLPSASGVPINNAAVNDTYAASTSAQYTLTVQQEPIQAYQETPLPSGYWTVPVSALNRDWWRIMGNWLNAGDTGPGAPGTGPTIKFNPYSTGPESAHVLWSRQYWAGGLMGAQAGDENYYGGWSYELYWSSPIILNGKIYYNVETPPRFGGYCVDLYTGKTDYFFNTSGSITFVGHPGANPSGAIAQGTLAFGQIYNYESPNQHGGFPYLWSTTAATSNTWMMYDAYTGNYICSIANVSSGGTAVYGKDGSILRYSLATTGGVQYLRVWNTSQAIWWQPIFNSPSYDPSTGTASFYYWEWRPYLNRTFDGNYGFSLNKSISPAVQGSILAVREDQYVIGGTTGSNNEQGIVQGNLWALSLKAGEEGTLLWKRTFTPPSSAGNLSVSIGTVDPEDGVFTFKETKTRQRWAYSLETGQLLWGPSKPEPQGAYYGMPEDIYQGMLLAGGVAAGLGNVYGYTGHIIAYNITTGEILWDYVSGNTGFETPYENTPIAIGCIADGKLYLFSTEHSPSSPLWRGSYLRCVNASNGAELWRISHWGNNPAIADGYIVDLNLYDNKIYCYGKGPSATTVTASPKVSVHGNSVMIEGTVTDQSPGAKDTPAISDADQQLWMEYLYMQRPIPTDAKGVEVSLDAIDPNNNYIHIGTATSDTASKFGLPWTPEVPGTYQIIATFAGSAAYGSSYSTTYINVGEAPPATAPPEYPQPIDNTMTIIAVGIAMIVALAIAVVLILRKK
jgi:hypothetical protein